MILTVTLNPAVDHTVRLDERLEADRVQRASEAQFDAGGKGINVSKHLVEFGTETLATGVLGGFLGSFVAERLTADGIPHDFVEIDGLTRLNTTVLTDEEYKINHTGPSVDGSVVERVIDRIERHDPETVVVAGSLPPSLDIDAIDRIAAAVDGETVVDVGGEQLIRLEETYALCKPNREELAAATGAPTQTVEECSHAAETLRASGFKRVVASLGADGALMATSSETIHVPAPETEVVDTVGAGDALLSGVLAARADGETSEEALQRGVRVAARAVAVPGTTIPATSSVDDSSEH